MTEKEQIRVEIERQRSLIEGLFIEGDNSFYDGQDDAYNHLLAFIDSLPDENNPEPYNPVYDEDYLNEKIAKATKSWEGVDVDAMLAECRGYEEKPSEDLEEVAEEWAENEAYGKSDAEFEMAYKGFIAGAEQQKAKMMKDSVEGEVIYDLGGFFRIKSEAIDGAKYKVGSWVKLLIVKE